MVITTNYYLLTIICEESVSEHLIRNIRQFEPTRYTVQEINSGAGNAEENASVKIEVLCSRTLYPKVVDYINQYYIKQYGVTCFMTEVNVPV